LPTYSAGKQLSGDVAAGVMSGILNITQGKLLFVREVILGFWKIIGNFKSFVHRKENSILHRKEKKFRCIPIASKK
jgi:hypothetical protein